MNRIIAAGDVEGTSLPRPGKRRHQLLAAAAAVRPRWLRPVQPGRLHRDARHGHPHCSRPRSASPRLAPAPGPGTLPPKADSMSPDEQLALFLAFILAFFAAAHWYATIVDVTGLGGGTRLRAALGVLPVMCLVLVFVVLRKWSDPQVPASFLLMWLFLASAVVWMA